MTSPRRPGPRSGAIRRQSCRKARPCQKLWRWTQVLPANPAAPSHAVAVRVYVRPSFDQDLERRIQSSAGRCFGDLFNLVYDPAFLVAAWERVAANKGAQAAGIDKATAAVIETRVGVGAFLGQIRGWLKAGEFRPVEYGR